MQEKEEDYRSDGTLDRKAAPGGKSLKAQWDRDLPHQFVPQTSSWAGKI